MRLVIPEIRVDPPKSRGAHSVPGRCVNPTVCVNPIVPGRGVWAVLHLGWVRGQGEVGKMIWHMTAEQRWSENSSFRGLSFGLSSGGFGDSHSLETQISAEKTDSLRIYGSCAALEGWIFERYLPAFSEEDGDEIPPAPAFCCADLVKLRKEGKTFLLGGPPALLLPFPQPRNIPLLRKRMNRQLFARNYSRVRGPGGRGRPATTAAPPLGRSLQRSLDAV